MAKLALQSNPFPKVEWSEILNQIAARDKTKDKLPTWYACEDIIYPSKISVEQTSSETAAKYKASLVSGESLIDLTGGFGIDDFYFAKKIRKVTHCELNLELSAIAKHNFSVLGADNIECLPGNSTDLLELLDRRYDWIYIDPSRRSDAKGKVFLLKDCLPDVPALLGTYFNHADNILIKTAPLLDITAGLGELKHVAEIHILAINNEVKELLWILKKGAARCPQIVAVNMTFDTTDVFIVPNEPAPHADCSFPKNYLYEPNSAVMRTGAFDAIAHHYNVSKLHKHSHLYTSDELIDFPGRRFTIEQVLPFQKNVMKGFENEKMNITVRNFPLQPDEIRKKWKIKDGGNTYAFFTTNKDAEKIIIIGSKA